MKLLLTHGYFLLEDPKELQIMKPYVPLGILYLCSHLRSKGFDIEVYDSTFGSKQELFSILRAGPPATLGIYANLMTRMNVLEIISRARYEGWRVIVGGPEPANYAEEYLEHGADLVIAGEAELTLERLIRTNFDRAHWPRIGGLFFRTESGSVARTHASDLIKDLDAQPWPDRGSVDVSRYLATWRQHHGVGSVSLITARGCPYRCNWCSHSVFGQTHRRRSARAVVDEVEFILGRYSPDMLWLADDVFTIHHGWLFEYASEMKRRALLTPFECITRADRLNEKVVETLAALRCFRVWIGSESGSQRILDAMQRGVTVEQVRNAVRLCKQAGIQTGMFLMWGYDGEEIPDIEETVAHVKTCRPDIWFTTVSYPIKGTLYYDRVAPRLVNLTGWERSTDREFRIKGRHSRRFYQYADELLRNETAEIPDPALIMASRKGLHATQHEVEA
ncbi:MAG: B12-binding domain-containing radical SAM protein [Acidobacteriaceae bacterium]|nr:B12-binding domain-containing radical SAM protein [Acidobacteriaceae bacterium]